MTVRLPNHLNLIATAPAGIQKLRGLILELAVCGKLVPQDPNDEPASELLKRIATERTRLEAAGICKKSKAMPLVGDDAPPFKLPAGWVLSRLSDFTLVRQRLGITRTHGVLSEDVLQVDNGLASKVRFTERRLEDDKILRSRKS